MNIAGNVTSPIGHTHGLPTPIGTITHRPIQRRNTSPFQRATWPDDPARFAAQQQAAQTLAKLDKRRKAKAPKPRAKGKHGGSVRTWDLNAAVKRYEAGESAEDIAASIGRSVKAVREGLSTCTTLRARTVYGQRPTFDVDAMLKEAPGMTQLELADRYGVTPRTVRRWLNRNGVTTRDARGSNQYQRRGMSQVAS